MKKRSRFRSWQYWALLLSFTLLIFYALLTTDYAWMAARAAASIAPRLLLLIAAGQVGYELLRAREYYKAAGEPKESWIIDDIAHCAGPVACPTEYETCKIDFFNLALLKQ